MSDYTNKYGFEKPLATDKYDVEVFNNNFEKVEYNFLSVNDYIREMVGFNNRDTELIYNNGELIEIRELDKGKIKRKATFTYDAYGELETMVDMIPGRTITSTLTYEDGKIVGIKNKSSNIGL